MTRLGYGTLSGRWFYAQWRVAPIDEQETVVESIGTKRRRLERDLRSDGGFTLLELMVVVSIIGVLLLAAIPLLIGAQDRARDTAAKAKTTTALKAQKAIYADNGGYGQPPDVELAEPTLDARPLPDGGEATVLGAVYVRDVSSRGVLLVSRSASGTCFWTKTDEGITLYAKGGCAASDVAQLTFGTTWP